MLWSQMKDILPAEIAFTPTKARQNSTTINQRVNLPIGLLVMQKDAASLTIPRRDFEHNLPAGADDDLRRPNFDEQAVSLLGLEEGNILGFVVSVREPFSVSGTGIVDGAEGSSEPACAGRQRGKNTLGGEDLPLASGTGSPAVPVYMISFPSASKCRSVTNTSRSLGAVPSARLGTE